jgi:DNA-binding FadR family transcriptional regulator
VARQLLVDTVVGQLLDGIIDGRLPAGSPLPPEAELADSLDVSRLTLREAIKVLQSQGVIAVKRGRPHEVNPVSQWTGIDPVLRSLSHDCPETVALQLVQVRRMIESGAAALAAASADDDARARIRGAHERMEQAYREGDNVAVAKADVAFHEAIVDAAENTILPVILSPLQDLLFEYRRKTSAVRVVQEHALEHHAATLKAIEARDPEAARRAMDAHMNQTEDDLRRYVLD